MLNFLVFLLFIPLFLIVSYSIRLGISPMPSSHKVKEALTRHLPPIHSGTIHELGAGWGGVAHLLARRYPHLQIIAYELSPLPFFFLWVRKRLFFLKNLKVRRADFRKADLTSASLLFAYLYPKAMKEIERMCEKEHFPATLISSTFSLPSHTPYQVVEVNDLYRTRIYFFRF